jgi:hypothetical protein
MGTEGKGGRASVLRDVPGVGGRGCGAYDVARRFPNSIECPDPTGYFVSLRISAEPVSTWPRDAPENRPPLLWAGERARPSHVGMLRLGVLDRPARDLFAVAVGGLSSRLLLVLS